MCKKHVSVFLNNHIMLNDVNVTISYGILNEGKSILTPTIIQLNMIT